MLESLRNFYTAKFGHQDATTPVDQQVELDLEQFNQGQQFADMTQVQTTDAEAVEDDNELADMLTGL